MYSTQVTTADRRLPGSIGILLAAAFAVGILTGLGVQGALERATPAGALGTTTPTAATRDDMSAAAYAAMHPMLPAVAGPSTTDHADDMSAAAYVAMRPVAGRAHDMSAAAYAAMHPDAASER